MLRVGRKGKCLDLYQATGRADSGEVFTLPQLIFIIENVCGIKKKNPVLVSGKSSFELLNTFEDNFLFMLQSMGKANRRKIRVTIGLVMILIAGVFLIYLGIGIPVWYLLLAGIFGCIVFILGILIIKANEAFSGNHLLQIGDKNTVAHSQLIQIDELGAHWFYKNIVWSVQENKFYHSIGWDFFKIMFEATGEIQTAYILIDPKRKKIFQEYLLTAQKNNPFLQLNASKYLGV